MQVHGPFEGNYLCVDDMVAAVIKRCHCFGFSSRLVVYSFQCCVSYQAVVRMNAPASFWLQVRHPIFSLRSSFCHLLQVATLERESNVAANDQRWSSTSRFLHAIK